ncbi:MAG TPA: PQQ-binding-like beta-propeller repeat protein [Nitrososphaeraceae archaeon]|nr:PQQ-binding-like beta-propeller repeat protein [Nitrososphaeraceae archaeon]
MKDRSPMSPCCEPNYQGSWSCFKGSTRRTGTSDYTFSRKPFLKNITKVGPVLSSPVSDGESVYVGTLTGRVYRIEIEGLIIKWHVNKSNPIVASPSIYKGHLLVGTFSKWIYEPAVHCEPSSVTALDAHDATEKWKYELQNGVFSSICSVEDIHVFGCLDGKIYALNNEGDLRWVFATRDEVWSSPSSDGQRIFVGSDDCTLYALDLDGKLVWKRKLGGKIRSSSPCVSGSPGSSSLYIGTRSGNLYRIDKDSGAILWSQDLKSPLLSSPSLIQNYVLIGSSDGYLHCVRSGDGFLIWKFKTTGKVWSSPLLTRGLKAIVGSLDSHIYYLDIPTGQLLWKFPTMDMIDSSPCLAGGVLLVGSRDGYLYSFDQGNKISYIS